MASSSRVQLEGWLQSIDVPAGHVIDFGGSQKSIQGRTRSWEATTYECLDLPRWDLNVPWLVEKTGDIGFALEVSEYLWDPVQALKNMRNCLKDGALLYMSFHFVYPDHEPAGTDYLRYTPNGVDKLLKEAGFEVSDHLYRLADHPQELMKFYRAEGMHPRKTANHSVIGSLITAVAV